MTERFQLRLLVAQECPVCLNLRDDDARDEAQTCRALFGAKRWAICPACGQQVTQQTAAYRVRARAFVGQLSYVEGEGEA